jgi:uncharacterized repeat protein (TIGR01451 family)
LEIIKAVDQPVVIAGTDIHYIITVRNNGPSDAQNVVVTDSLPFYVTGLYYSLDGTNWSIWSNVITLGTLATNAAQQIWINGTVSHATPNGTVLNNTVNVTSPTDPNVHEAWAVSSVNTLAELVITKVADVEKIIRGYPIHYTVTITNLGPSDALNVNFYDDYDPKILLNTYYSTSTGITWTAFDAPLIINNIVTSLAPGDSIIIWINGTVDANASENLTNIAVTNSETDSEGNKTAQVTIPIQTSHVTIEKTVSDPRPYVHETIYFTLIVQNWGPDTAIDVYVDDKLPAGVKYVSSTANYGSYDPNTGIWTIGNLTKDTIAQLVMYVVVEKVGPLENHAHVYTASWDPIMDDHSATASLEVLPAPVHGKTIGMRNTGLPLPLMVLAVLAVLAGLIRPKRK